MSHVLRSLVPVTWLVAAVSTALLPCSLGATEFFVDNRIGSDRYDGRTVNPLDERTGPFKSIGRALSFCDGGDRITIVNTGYPYYESLQLFGERHSGGGAGPFTINGNGAVISGQRMVPPEMWKYAGDELWQLHTHRKGHVLLTVEGQLVPQHPGPPALLPLGRFCLHRGIVNFRGDVNLRPPAMPFTFGYEDVGVTFYKVHDVTLRDLNFEYFRLDGAAAPDSARRITLENCTLKYNGRAGLSLDGISTVLLRNGAITGNAEHSVLLKGTAALEAEGDVEWDVEPTVELRAES